MLIDPEVDQLLALKRFATEFAVTPEKPIPVTVKFGLTVCPLVNGLLELGLAAVIGFVKMVWLWTCPINAINKLRMIEPFEKNLVWEIPLFKWINNLLIGW